MWQEELTKILEAGCSDSDVEDFIEDHIFPPDVTGKDVWDFVYEYHAPQQCKGCRFIQNEGEFPCNRCSRIVNIKDYYDEKIQL